MQLHRDYRKGTLQDHPQGPVAPYHIKFHSSYLSPPRCKSCFHRGPCRVHIGTNHRVPKIAFNADAGAPLDRHRLSEDLHALAHSTLFAETDLLTQSFISITRVLIRSLRVHIGDLNHQFFAMVLLFIAVRLGNGPGNRSKPCRVHQP